MFLGTLNKLPLPIKQTLLKLFVSGLLFWSGLAALFPTLPLYLEDLGFKPFQIGLVMAGFGVGVLVFRPSLGRISDLRSRKLALLIGMAVTAIAPLGYLGIHWVWLLLLPVRLALETTPLGFAVTSEWLLLLPLRIFHGLSMAAFASAFLMLVADLTPAANRGEVIGYMSLEQPLGLSIGPAIGGLVMDAAGYPAVFGLSALFGFSACLLAWRIPEQPVTEQVPSRKAAQGFWLMLANPRIRVPAIVMLLVGISIGTMHTFAPPYIRAMHIGFNPGFFFTAIAVTTFMIRLVAGLIGDRWGRGVFITYSLLCSSIAMVLLWTAHTALVLLLAALMLGAGFGIIVPMMAALMADRSPANERGRAFSLCMMGFDVGLALGGPFLGSLAEITGYRHLFGIAASLFALGLLAFITCGNQNLDQSIRFATGRGPDAYALSSVEQ